MEFSFTGDVKRLSANEKPNSSAINYSRADIPSVLRSCFVFMPSDEQNGAQFVSAQFSWFVGEIKNLDIVNRSSGKKYSR